MSGLRLRGVPVSVWKRAARECGLAFGWPAGRALRALWQGLHTPAPENFELVLRSAWAREEGES